MELMAVASLIALAASGSVILMLRSAKSLQVEQTANRLMLAAKSARVTAIQDGAIQILVIDQQKNRFFVISGENEANRASAANLPESADKSVSLKYLTTLPEGVTFEKFGVAGMTEETQNQIRFKANGSAQTAVVQVGNGTHHATITILEATGRVKLQEGTIDTITQDWIDLDEEEAL